MKKLGLLLFSCLIYLGSIAQTGPGGVGSSSSNLIWLEADNISSLSDGDPISSWGDGSGNTNDLSQPNASFQPEYKTSILNGLPVVRFYQANGRMRKTAFVSPTAAVTAIYVNANLESGDGIISYTSSTDNDFLIYDSDNINIYRGTNRASGVSSNDGSFHIINVGWRSSDGSTELWKDGTRSFTATHQTGTSITSGGSFAIAGEQDSPDGGYTAVQDHLGDFAEVILFNTYLNRAQHIIVSNYLATKYNLTIANDYYSYETTYPYDVAGIGRENASNIHTSAMSANILRIENPSGLNADQEYLLFGHDNADATAAWTTTEAPNAGVNIQRLAREWRINETNDVGTVDFVIDINNMPAAPAGHIMYALMIDSDGDFSNGASVYELSLSAGTEYSVSGIDVADGDYVAIAVLDPKIEHLTATSSDFEPNNAVIEVALNFITQTDRTVTYNTADGTALSAQPDYTAVVGGTATILAGNQSATYTITINNDIVVESSETFSVTLSSPSAGLDLGTNSVHTYSINDDDDNRKVYFSLASSSGLESVTAPTITVAINNTDPVNPTTVDYSVIGGTAVGGGTDYTLASGTATIAANTASTQISLSVNNELLYELDETVIVELSNPSNCNLDGVVPLGGTGFLQHTYTILNNDLAPVIGFDVTSASGDESSTPINIQVNLDAISGVDASVSYTVSGTASGSGVDYTLANGTISIAEGNLNSSFLAIIVDDILEEADETIVVTLSGAVDASIGSGIYTYTINDNDNFGHLGPGGVGEASNNILWVKSDDITPVANGTDITAWADASGNSNNLSQGNTSFTPRYYNSIINGRPVVRFDQANGRLIRTAFADFPTTAITTIFVNSNTDAGDGLVSYASSASSNEYLLFNSSNMTIFRGGTSNATGTAVNGGTFRIVSNTWRSSDGRALIYRNGTQTYTGTIASGTPIVSGGCLAIAGEQDGINSGYDASQSHQGDYAEVIFYNQVLNSAKRKIVNNYLSAKYNIAIANDLYAFDAPGNYEYEVAGIGRDNGSNLHKDAQGTAIVRINTPSSLGDGDYLIWGHDNADRTLDTIDIPGTVDNRLNRVWKIQETGDMGTVSVHFDVSSFTITNSADLVLLIDSDDGLFVNASIIPLSSFSSNIATFDNVDFSTGNWFTIASLSRDNALPIELAEFNARLNGEQVDLNWKTYSEINNDYFTIERSADLKSWHSIRRLAGAGTTTSAQSYASTDENPLKGTSYYRLKQTDFDGTSSYSEVEAVNFRIAGLSKLNFYPNPASNQLTIEGEMLNLELLQVYNSLGQNVNSKLSRVFMGDNRLVLDVSNLQKGYYLLRSGNASAVMIKE